MMKSLSFLKRLVSIKTLKVYKINCNKVPPILFHDIKIKPIDFSNLYLLEELRNKIVVNNFKKFLSDGEKGFMVIKKNKCIAHGWLILNTSNIDKIACEYFNMSPNSAFIHYCYVDEAQRGQGIYKYLLTSIIKYCYSITNLNFNILIDTGINNIPAQRAIVSIGGEYLNKLHIFRCLGKNLLVRRGR